MSTHSSAPQPRIAILPRTHAEYAAAITAGGGQLVEAGPDVQGLIWAPHDSADDLRTALQDLPNVKWVQLPSAGVDSYVAADVFTPDIVWTSAKGAYARPVAEHALALTLAGLRGLHNRARAQEWGEPAGISLFGRTVVIVGAGGIGRSYAELLKPFEVEVIAVRRSSEPVDFADRTVHFSRLKEVLPDADVLLLACPLTPETRQLIDTDALAALPASAVLVNVGRGPLIDTEALTQALAAEEILAACLDVTDPEPLPAGHALWSEPRVLITPHTADTKEMIEPLLAERIRINVEHFAAGKPLEGIVDVNAGY